MGNMGFKGLFFVNLVIFFIIVLVGVLSFLMGKECYVNRVWSFGLIGGRKCRFVVYRRKKIYVMVIKVLRII